MCVCVCVCGVSGTKHHVDAHEKGRSKTYIHQLHFIAIRLYLILALDDNLA